MSGSSTPAIKRPSVKRGVKSPVYVYRERAAVPSPAVPNELSAKFLALRLKQGDQSEVKVTDGVEEKNEKSMVVTKPVIGRLQKNFLNAFEEPMNSEMNSQTLPLKPLKSKPNVRLKNDKTEDETHDSTVIIAHTLPLRKQEPLANNSKPLPAPKPVLAKKPLVNSLQTNGPHASDSQAKHTENPVVSNGRVSRAVPAPTTRPTKIPKPQPQPSVPSDQTDKELKSLSQNARPIPAVSPRHNTAVPPQPTSMGHTTILQPTSAGHNTTLQPTSVERGTTLQPSCVVHATCSEENTWQRISGNTQDPKYSNFFQEVTENALNSQEGADEEWSDVSEESQPTCTQPKSHPARTRLSSRKRWHRQKSSSSRKRHKRGGRGGGEAGSTGCQGGSIANATEMRYKRGGSGGGEAGSTGCQGDSIANATEGSECEWETDPEELVDSQGYEDVERIRQLARAALRANMSSAEQQKERETLDISAEQQKAREIENMSSAQQKNARGTVNMSSAQQQKARETVRLPLSVRSPSTENEDSSDGEEEEVRGNKTLSYSDSSNRKSNVSASVPTRARGSGKYQRRSTKQQRTSAHRVRKLPALPGRPKGEALVAHAQNRDSIELEGSDRQPTPTLGSSESLSDEELPVIPERGVGATHKSGPGGTDADLIDTPPPPRPPKGPAVGAAPSHAPDPPPTGIGDFPQTAPPPPLPHKSQSDAHLCDVARSKVSPKLPDMNKRHSAQPGRVPAPAPHNTTDLHGCSSQTSTMSVEVPAPRDSMLSTASSLTAQYVDPYTIAVAAPPVPDKYLPMDQSSRRPRPTLYLSVLAPISEDNGGPQPCSPRRNSYLQLGMVDYSRTGCCSTVLEEEQAALATPASPGASSLFSAEPLYQIYHCGAVLRDVITNELDDPESEENIYEDGTTVKGYVESILSRAGYDQQGASDVRSGSHMAPSSLEHAVTSQNRAGVRTLWAEMKQVKLSGVLNTIDASARKLQESIFEILTSEASYVKSLDVLTGHFMAAPELNLVNREKCLIGKRDHQILFSNVHRVRSVSKKFLSEVEKIWRRNCVLDPLEICELVRDFTENQFDVYVKYCSNQIYQGRKLDELRKSSMVLALALRRLEQCDEVQGLTLQSFLTLPMQRITRLPLLMDAVCHRLDPKRAEYTRATACLHAVQKLVKKCNEGARRMNNLEQVAEIDRMLEFTKKTKRVPLVSQSRSLVKKGPVVHIMAGPSTTGLIKGIMKKKKETLYLFLFNDLLLVVKRKRFTGISNSEEVYKVIDHDARINIHADIISTEDSCKISSSHKNLFKMALLGVKSEYIMAAESESERMRWVEAVTPVQQRSEHERVYESWDCPQVQAVHAYSAQQPDELSLEESDVINVTRKMSDGWYEGERIRDGEVGWFLSTHVVEIVSSHVRARNLRQRYRMLEMSMHELADMLENPQQAWRE